MPEPTAALQAVRASTADLVQMLAAQPWSDADAAAPSLLPGWTRGHVLTHLARNADATTRTLSGALRGEIVARYPDGPAARDRDIEAGAARPYVELVQDLTASAERLDRVFSALSHADGWELPAERSKPAGTHVYWRLREVEIHRVDLASDYTPERWPRFLVANLLPEVAESLPSRALEPLHVEITSEGPVGTDLVGTLWAPEDDGAARTVAGPDWAILAWLVGRGSVVSHVIADQPELKPWR